MAIRITRIDDIDGTEGAEAMTLELDHTAYEIDLCPRNRARLLRIIRPYIERARPLESDATSTGSESTAELSGPRHDRKNAVDDLEAGVDRIPRSRSLDLIEMAREVRD